MRNREIIAAINDKLVAALHAAGASVTPLTLDQLAAPPEEWNGLPALPYMEALTDDEVHAAMLPPEPQREVPRNADDGLPQLTREDKAFIAGVEIDPDDVVTNFSAYVESSLFDDPDEKRLAMEEHLLSSIPAYYRGPRQDGQRITRKGIRQAEDNLEAAFTDPSEASEFDRAARERFVRQVAARFAPADFSPQKQGAAGETERAMAGWAVMRDQRDRLIRDALAAGVTKTRVKELTGLSRSTIDRIPGVGPNR